MIEGTFDVAIDTPKHHKRGTLALKSDGDAIHALLRSGEFETALSGTCADKTFTFAGTGEFGELGTVEYKAEGEVWGNSIDVKCDTSIGKVTVFGTRLSQSAGDVKSSHEYMMAASRADFSKEGIMYSGLYSDGS